MNEYTQCLLCKNKATDRHHLIMGNGGRQFSERNKLVIKICGVCHKKIHDDGAFAKLSCIAGQLMYEENHLEAKVNFIDETRKQFMKEHGRSYL